MGTLVECSFSHGSSEAPTGTPRKSYDTYFIYSSFCADKNKPVFNNLVITSSLKMMNAGDIKVWEQGSLYYISISWGNILRQLRMLVASPKTAELTRSILN